MYLNPRHLQQLLAIAMLGAVQAASAQSVGESLPPRATGGWRASVVDPPLAAGVQKAYFQAQAGLSDGMPALPPSLGGNAAARGSGPLPGYPPNDLRPGFAGSGGAAMAYPGPASAAPGSGGPGSTENALATGGGQPYGGISPASGTSAGVPRGDNPVLPPAQRQPPQALPAALPGSSSAAAGQRATNELRAIQSANPAASSPRLAAQDITSGLPFVTPPPRGNYATSPYQPAVFQASAVPPRGVAAQFASNTSNVPTYLTAQQATLPQYQSPGIYPTAFQCTSPAAPSFPSTGAVPGAYVPPTLPPNMTPNLYTPNNAGYSPLFSLGQENYNVLLGRGIIGQPTVYVPGQPIRNFMRYLSP